MTADRPGPDAAEAAGARPGPPGPVEGGGTAEFVGSLARLRQWAGEPSLSRLRSLGGEIVTADGVKIDALPKSTTSHVLRQADKLPRWDFVRAFVTACLRNCDHPDELISRELERWLAARSALAESMSAVDGGATAEGPIHAPGQAAVPTTAESTTSPAEGVERPVQDAAVRLLVRRVAQEEDRARKGLLSGHDIAPVSFGAHTGEGAADEGTSGEASGDLRSIGRFFSGLRPQRLLVVGESGAGKTVLAIELVLQLLEPFLTAAEPPTGRPMVPVRVNAARWTQGRPFESWLAEQLVQEFGLAAADATRLVRDRTILPVVDGLDELDPQPSPGPPRRAMGLLTELNRYSDLSGRRPGPVVVTCRADRHAELARARTGLATASRIHLHHLTADQIGSYLNARWPDGHPCRPHRDAVQAALADPSGEVLRTTLATPWRLLLTVTAVESGADPAELLRSDPDADPGDAVELIARRLLDAYVPAATRLAPRSAHGMPYEPEQVRSWLVLLTAHLRRQAEHAAEIDEPPPGLTAIDLVPHLLWPIGGRRRVRALHGLCCAILAIIAMVAFWAGSAVDGLADLRDGLDAAQGLTLALATGWMATATILSLSAWPAATGGRASVPRRRRVIGGLFGALAGVPVGALGGLTGLALTGGRAFGTGFAVLAGAAGGAALGAVIGVTAAGRRGSERMTVREAIRADPLSLLGFGLCGALTGSAPLRLASAGPVALAAGVTGAFVLAAALGTAFKIANGGWSEDAELAHPREALHRNPAIGVAFGLTGGVAAFLVFVMNGNPVRALACALIGGVTFGLAFGAIAWSRTMIGLLVAAGRGLLPLRLWTFLDWACEARLLRVSGATYQFRHRELQDFLTPANDPGED
ncbi:NACHT domain-containing protein [Spirillospora sp. NPDC047279]|uniref:NACHT domain-containing protein n=1 Tax=Spirillospora sp. NPDC047279 TaxID=3155478 RepID=UPI0033FE2308